MKTRAESQSGAHILVPSTEYSVLDTLYSVQRPRHSQRSSAANAFAACAGIIVVLLLVQAVAAGDDPIPQSTTDSKPQQPYIRVAGIVLKWLRTDKEANYIRAEKLIESAAQGGAQLVCTTECFLDGYAIKDKSIPLDQYRALGELIPDGQYYQRLAKLADRLDIYLIAGMLEADGENRYNTAAFLGPDGRLIGKYRKHKLEHELVRNTPGAETPVFRTPLGNLGIMICADRRDADLVKRLRGGGANLLICPSGGMFGPRTNDPIVQARSKENAVPIVFVHPAEFLVTDAAGEISSRTILGDKLEITAPEIGTGADTSGVYFFDLPLHRTTH